MHKRRARLPSAPDAGNRRRRKLTSKGVFTCERPESGGDLPPLDQEIPNDKNHRHYGLGQTEAHLELPPGRHTLQMLFADDAHVPHNPPLYSKKITIIVPP